MLDLSQMTHEDLKSIKDILYSDFDNFWTYEVLKDELSSEISKYFVCKINDIVVGFCGIKITLDTAEIMNIVIKKDFRGQGLSDQLLSYVINICKQLNIKSINLEVNVENTIAINLYKKYNFVKVGLRKKYYDNTTDALLMTLDL